VRTTEGVRTTGEHDPEGCFTQQPDTPHKSKWALKRRGAQPKASVNPRKPGGAHNQKRAHDRGARPRGCFTQKPDAPHESKWALKRRGAQPKASVNPRKPGGAHNQKRAHDRGARPKGCFIKKPDTREL